MKEQITEKDLFDFVFYPETLSEEKFFLIKNSEKFSQEIAFFQQLKLSIEAELSNEEKKLLENKIPTYPKTKVILLKRVDETVPTRDENYRLSAASETELVPQLNIKTFIDDSRDFIIKVLESETNTKIFVFSTQNLIINDFKIFIEPKNLEFYFKDNSKPLILNETLKIESIKILFD